MRELFFHMASRRSGKVQCMKWLEKMLLLCVTLVCLWGCSGKPEVTHSKEELQQKQIERANLMQDAVNKKK